MNFRSINALLWGNSVALAWMWGLGLFFSVQMTFVFGVTGLLLFAVPNAIGLGLFGFLTHIVAQRHGGGQESLARFFERFSKPFRLVLFLYQFILLTLTAFAITNYLIRPLTPSEGLIMPTVYLGMGVLVVLAAGCLSGEELGIRGIKRGHAVMGAILLAAVVAVCLGLKPFVPEKPQWGPVNTEIFRGPALWAYIVPLTVGFLVGPWLDLQHWQRAIQIHRENTSIRASYVWGALIFFALLIFHGLLAGWVFGKLGPMGPDELGIFTTVGPDGFHYAHQAIVLFFQKADAHLGGWLAPSYFVFLGICALTTLDSGYVALKWFLGSNVAKSQNLIIAMVPKRLLESPIPTFLVVAAVAFVSMFAKLELEYFIIFYGSFFVGYAALAIARCFVPNSQQPLPQIRLFSVALISLAVFALGYVTSSGALFIAGSLLPPAYVIWLVGRTDLLRVVTEKASEVLEAASSEIPAIKTITRTASAIGATNVSPPAPQDAHALAGHFEGKWFVYSFVATYQDTNSVGNVYFGMYALFVGKTRELFFNAVLPEFDLKTTPFYILTRSFEHKFMREAREFDVITVKIRVADANRKFCTLEHQVFGSDNELLGKGRQSLLFVSSKDYSLLNIPTEVHTAFLPYL